MTNAHAMGAFARWTARGLAAILLGLLAGCTAGSAGLSGTALEDGNRSLIDELPPVPLDLGGIRAAAAQSTAVVDGVDAWQNSPGATPFNTFMRLPAVGNTLEWALYRYAVASDVLISVKANIIVGAGEKAWIGIANYETLRWEFLGPYPETTNTIFNGLSAGQYTSAGGYAYLVVVSYDMTTTTVQSIEFTTDTQPPVTFTVAGTVTESAGSTPLAGADVLATPGNYQATTAADGSYTLSGMPAGDYAVSVSLSGYSFAPPSQDLTLGPDATGVDFSGTIDSSTYDISGTITNSEGGAGLPNVLVTVSPGGFVTSTNFSGNYAFTGLDSGQYTVTPQLANFDFAPVNQIVNLGPSASNVDFLGTLQQQQKFTISGQVSNTAGGFLQNVEVTLQPGSQTAFTNSSGQYSFGSLDAGTYTLTPALTGFTFDPVDAQVTVGPDASNVNFAGTQDQEEITYTVHMQPIFSGHCMPCHNSTNQFGGVILDTYAGAFANAENAYAMAEFGAMPPGGNDLNAEELATFAQWISGGKPE